MSVQPTPSSAGAGAGVRRGVVPVLIETDVADHQRLPMLELVCDRLLRSLGTSMRQLTGDAMDVSLIGVTGGRFGDLLGQAESPAMFGVFRIDPWGSHGLLLIEPALIYASVDALLGGRRSASGPQRMEGRPFTSIETGLVGRLMDHILRDFSAAFQQVAPISTRLERIETSPRFAAFAGPSIATAHCQFQIDMEGRGGRFSLLLPSTTLEPVRDILAQRFGSERLSSETSWASDLEEEVRSLPLRVEAVVGRRTLTLSEVQVLAPGDHLRFGAEPGRDAMLVHGGIALARVAVGQRHGKVALCLQHAIGNEVLS